MVNEHLTEQLVTYTLELDGRVYLIEHVPARVNVETGEQLFAPETVERLQRIVWESRAEARSNQAPVFDFAT